LSISLFLSVVVLWETNLVLSIILTGVITPSTPNKQNSKKRKLLLDSFTEYL